MIKDILLVLTSNITSISCSVGASFLAYNHISGWGWFLFVACITVVTPRITAEVKNKKEDKVELLVE